MIKYLLVFSLVLQLCGYTSVIVLLQGSGSSGKTSLTRSLTKLDQNWYPIDEDTVYSDESIRGLTDLFPNEIDTISKAISKENMFKAILVQCICFKDRSDETSQKEAIVALFRIWGSFTKEGARAYKANFHNNFEKLLQEEIQKGLSLNKNVILDSWYSNHERIQKDFPNTRVIRALNFTSLTTTYERFKKRNLDALRNNTTLNRRTYLQLFPHYVNLFKLTTNPKDGLSQCQRFQIENIFDEALEDLKTIPIYPFKYFISKELTVSQLSDLKAKFLPPSISSEVVYIAPRDNYDIILNTKNATSEESATLFLNKVEEILVSTIEI